MLSYFLNYIFMSADFYQIKKSGKLPECQTVLIQKEADGSVILQRLSADDKSRHKKDKVLKYM